MPLQGKMSRETYQEGCKGCDPVVINMLTGKRLPANHPMVVATLKVWNTFNSREKEAWHEFTCGNSKEPQVQAVARRVKATMAEVLKKLQ